MVQLCPDYEFQILASELEEMRNKATYDKTYKAGQMGRDIVKNLVNESRAWWANATLDPRKSRKSGKNLIPPSVLDCVEQFLYEEQERNEKFKVWNKKTLTHVRRSFRKKVSEICTNARTSFHLTRPRRDETSLSSSD